MIKVTQLQRDNAISAKEMWLTVPEANVSPGLSDWSNRYAGDEVPDCGTQACFGGWCAWWPAFQAQGLKASGLGSPIFEDDGHSKTSCDVSKTLFGHSYMFVTKSHDYLVYKDRAVFKNATDWQIVMNRIEHLIESSIVTKD